MDSSVFSLSSYPCKDNHHHHHHHHHHPSIDQLTLSSTATLVGSDLESETKNEYNEKNTDLVFRSSACTATDSSSDAASDTDNTSIDESDPRSLLEQRWKASPSVHLPYPRNTWATPVLEIVACILWTSLPLMCFAALYFSFHYLWYPLMAYVAWILVFDASTPFTGGTNRGRWFVRMPIWGYYRSYFSNRTVLTPEAAAPGAFDAHEKYIFGYSPHGMYCLGAFASFCLPRRSDCPLPKNICLTTLGMGFFVPFFRELLYAYGFIGVGKKSVFAVLNKVDSKEGKPEKKAVLICIGGAREAMWSCPGRLKLVLKKRKGFAKMAIQTGAALVPVLSFGENNVFHQMPNPPGSVLRTLQEFVLRFLHFSPVIFSGDTILGYLLPRRKSLVTVVGAPIAPGPIDSNPSEKRLDELHALYMKNIQQMWDDYKDIYATDRTAEMQIVE